VGREFDSNFARVPIEPRVLAELSRTGIRTYAPPISRTSWVRSTWPTQETNVKVSPFPLIHLDETILAHTKLAEYHKFLQEKENKALLDRMVIIKVPYAVPASDDALIRDKYPLKPPTHLALRSSFRCLAETARLLLESKHD
jgi:hypothetical protein